MDSLHIDMNTANRIFTLAQSDEAPHLLGTLRSADDDALSFHACHDENELKPNDLPVLLGEDGSMDDRDHLRVITDTRGVMQLHAYRVVSGSCEELLINTES